MTMNISDADRAKVLVQALPYIQKYAGKTVVVKYGGNAMINEGLKDAVMSDIVLMQLVGINVVLVHGGGPEISCHAQKDRQGEPALSTGCAIRTAETIDIVQMVLAGKVNKDLVQLLERHSGQRRRPLRPGRQHDPARKRWPPAEDLGYVGEITEVNTQIIEDATDRRAISPSWPP